MSGYSERVRTAWRGNHLFSVLLELTYRCNLDCFFCYNDLSLHGRPLTRERYLRLLDELVELQTLHLALSGGEPLAHPDFFLLGRRARELGFVVRVKSNGHALRGALARRLRDEVDPYLVEVSLHGATAATHDRQTRVPGSFERLLANLREMQALGLRLRINSTLTSWNEEEMPAMYDLADELGIPLRFDPEVTPRDDGSAEPLSIAPSLAGLRRLFEMQEERAARTGVEPEIGPEGDSLMPALAADKHCGAGSGGVTIDPYGNVYPCVQWRRRAGNLHDASLAEIWRGSPELAEVRRLTVGVSRKLAAAGPDGGLGGFCPGIAESLTGSPQKLYPGMLQRQALLRELRVARLRAAAQSRRPKDAP